MPRQYAFDPQPVDPRQFANQQWDDLRTEVNVTRDALERSDAECTAQAALIDMLRKEHEEYKVTRFRTNDEDAQSEAGGGSSGGSGGGAPDDKNDKY